MDNLISDPKTLIYAVLGGALPAILWLWFWLRQEDGDDKEPTGLIIMSFVLGGVMVLLAIWLQRYSATLILDKTWQIIAFAAIEEILKMLAVIVVVFGSGHIDQPIDYPMYFIAAALGFAALENVFFLINPLQVDGTVVGLLTGNLRFLGSTLLHAIASSMIGSAFGLAFYIKRFKKRYAIIGLLLAITLHSLFNFFIMKGSGENFLSVFGFLWVVAIINILIFEKLRRMSPRFAQTI
ncbi:MAG: PrsW family glutamic-type intramembrane protease [Candidatus Paceibacterota bacterium]